MALFFDQTWFNRRLEAVGRTPGDLAEAMGIPLIDLAAVWKDQRELSPAEVRAMARLLQQPVAEVAARAGISTPVPADEAGTGAMPDSNAVLHRLDDIVARLDRLERAVADVKALARDLQVGSRGGNERIETQ